MDMRVRFPELLKASGLTPYKVSKQSGDRISMSMAYRLKRKKGRLPTFDADVLEALCDVFEIKNMDDLFERSRR
jgi:hypothetical protein